MRLLIVVGLLLSILPIGCKLSEEDKDIVVKIESEFQLGMNEKLGQQRDFQLTFQTIQDQSCTTNSIAYFSNRSGRNVYLSLNEIVETPNCLTGQGPATDTASYSNIPNGAYNLELVLKNTISSKGTLTVSNEKFTLDITEGHGFQLGQATLMRVPATAIWGYVAYKDAQYLSGADQFLEQLNGQTESLKLNRGEYGHFRIGDGDRLSLNKAPDYNNFRTFYRTSKGQLSALEALLEGFRSQYPDGQMEFRIFTGQGETL